tara:strand:+ start:705 stop:983 length:279 start_codon:yes stop_codon:yes gene_type:complete
MSHFDDWEDSIVIANGLFSNGDKWRYQDTREYVRYNIKWQTRDGQSIAFDDMDTNHIRNCIKMLRRRGEKHDKLLADTFVDVLRDKREEGRV